MPDKEIMLKIRALEEQRGWGLFDRLPLAKIDGEPTSGTDEDVRDALAWLAENWRETADKYAAAKLKGAQTAHVVPLRAAAQQLDIVIKQLDQPRRAPLGQLQDGVKPISSPPSMDPATHPQTGLDALISDSIAEHRGELQSPPWLLGEPHPFVAGPDGRLCCNQIERGGDVVPCGLLPGNSVHDSQAQRALVGEHGPEIADLPAGALVLSASSIPCCEHMIDGDEDPAPWCDCRSDDTGEHTGPCKLKAHIREQHGIPLQRRVELDTARDGSFSDDVTAYLAGALDTPPGPDPAPSTVVDAAGNGPGAVEPANDLGVFGVDERPYQPGNPLADREPQESTNVTQPANYQEQRALLDTSLNNIPPIPLLGQPGDAGSGYAHTYVPPGGQPLTFADLLQLVAPADLPTHISHSQIDTIADCPAKYRMSRVAGVVEIPQWANIGGTTFHAIAEHLERTALQTGYPMPSPDRAEGLWTSYFDAEITKLEQSSPVPRSRWRASKQGAEGETWWRANGPEMIKRYLAARPDERTASLPLPAGPGVAVDYAPAIEIELSASVQTGYGPIEYRAILDRVTVRHQHGAPLPTDTPTLVIRDYKTGDRMPSDASQLGEYAQLLRLRGVPPSVKILGTFFNARKGTWTEPRDLEQDGYTAEWFAYRVTAGHAQRLALTQGPTPARPSQFCGGCSVRYACPIKAMKS